MSVRIAVAGAGLVGQRHIEAITSASDAELAAIVEPADIGTQVAGRHGVPHHATLDALFDEGTPDGVILATPNQTHVETALACIERGIPALVEKPLAADLAGAEAIAGAARKADVAVLTGHHRRHNPLIAKAHDLLNSGGVGRITAVQGTAWLYKPDDYFNVAWRRKPGAGPVFINLIHDIDMLRHLCGEIVSVHAVESNAVRGHAVEDTAAVLVTFAGGALGTISVSDTIVAPFSWELTARENPAYPATSESCYLIGGTEGTLSLPDLTLWSNPQERGWWQPIGGTRFPVDFDDPLVRQIEHFAAVIRGETAPLVSAEEGARNLAVIEAIKTSARTGETVRFG